MRFRWALVIVLAFAALAYGPAMAAWQGGAPAPAATGAEWNWGLVWAYLASRWWQWLKQHPRVTFISNDLSARAQTAWSVLLALATAAGLHVTFDSTAGVLTVTGLTWLALKEAVRQWACQQIVYHAVVKPATASKE